MSFKSIENSSSGLNYTYNYKLYQLCEF